MYRIKKIFNNSQKLSIMKTNNQLAERFAEILVRKMEEMESEKWEKPWFDVSGKINFYPQNYTKTIWKNLSKQDR